MNPDEYVKLAAVEDRMWYFAALHRLVERALERTVPEKASVLDAGCGTGGLIRRLEARWRWTGLDASAQALGAARSRATAATFVEASVTDLPFGAASFDAIVSADVLYSVQDDVGALREFARILKPGGTLVVNVQALPWLWSYHDVAVHAVRRYTRNELRAKVLAAGFSSVDITHTGMLTLPIVAARRKLLPAPKSGSDVSLMPAPAELFFGGLAALERSMIGLGLNLPIGSSLFAVARR